MLHEVVAGLGRGFRKTAAKAMSNDYNYYQPEKKSLEFTTSTYRNCQTYGCNQWFRSCDSNSGNCARCRPDAHAE
jgi:hypothetical protein